MSAVSKATSLPAAPMAIPTVLFAIAGASFTPSPTIATFFSVAFSFSMAATFCSGNKFPHASVMPICFAIASATLWLSPVNMIILRIPFSFNWPNVSFASFLATSINVTMPMNFSFSWTSIVVFPCFSSSSILTITSAGNWFPFSINNSLLPIWITEPLCWAFTPLPWIAATFNAAATSLLSFSVPPFTTAAANGWSLNFSTSIAVSNNCSSFIPLSA